MQRAETYESMKVGDTRPAWPNSTEEGLYDRLQEIRDVTGAQFRVHGKDDAKFDVTRVR